MNANVAGGVGGEDEGSLPDALMAQNLTETVYLGRASFRITHEIEAVQPVEEPETDSSTWFSHDATVILRGGPNGLVRHPISMTERTPELELVDTGPAHWLRRWWLVIALPVAAFALGIVVARHKAGLAVVTAHAPGNVTVAPPAPVAIAPIIAPPVAVAVAAPAPVAEVPPSMVAGSPAAVVAAVPSDVAVVVPAAPEPEHASAFSTVSRQGRPAQRHVARKPKTDRPAVSDTASSATPDDAPAVAEDAPPPVAKKAAVKWVDPWAN